MDEERSEVLAGEPQSEAVSVAAIEEPQSEASDEAYCGSIYGRKSLRLLVVLIGILIVFSVYLWTGYKYGDAISPDFYADPAYQASADAEYPARYDEASWTPVKGESYVIYDSYYQKAEGYSWQDLYTTLITLIETTPLSEGDEALYCMLDEDYLETPFICTCIRRADGSASFTIGLYARERYYSLLTAERELLFDRDSGAFYDPVLGIVYRYAPHVFLGFLAEDQPMTDFSFDTLPFIKASAESPVSVEEIETLVVRFGEGSGT